MPERRRIRLPLAQLIVAVLIGALAFAITVQIRQDESRDYSNVRGGELVELLKSLDAANARLDSQIQDLTSTRAELLDSTKRSEQAEQEARIRASQLAILAGTAGATGPGITLTITDPDEQVDSAALLDAIEELRDAGAEAIVVNGVARVVAQTYLLDDGQSVRVGGREVKRPFVIEAIGDPATMAEAVRFRGGLMDRLETRGASARIREEERVTITALADVLTPEYAQPSS